MASSPLRDWSASLLLLGGIVLTFALAMVVAQGLLASAGERTYGFARLAPAGIGLGALLLTTGGLLRVLASPRPRFGG